MDEKTGISKAPEAPASRKRPWRTPEVVQIYMPTATKANGFAFFDGVFAGDLS